MQSNNNNSNHFFFKYLENQLLHIQKKSCSTSTNTFQILDSLCGYPYIWKYTWKNSWRKLQNPLKKKKKKALFKRRIHVGLFIRPKFYKRQWRRRCYRDAFYGRGRERWTRVSFCKYNRGSWIVAFGHTRTWRDNKDCSCDWRRSGTSGMGTFASRRMRTRPISENLHAFFRRWRTRGWNLPLVGNTLEQKRHNAQVRWHRARSIDRSIKFSTRFLHPVLSTQFSRCEDKRGIPFYTFGSFVVEPAIDRRSSKGRQGLDEILIHTRRVIESSLEVRLF